MWRAAASTRRPAAPGDDRRPALRRRIPRCSRGAAPKSLPLLYLGYGVIGGTGLGLGYVMPVATVAKWFRRSQGSGHGHRHHGFRLRGAVDEQAVRALLVQTSGGNLVAVFGWLGVGFTVIVVGLGALLHNPPDSTEKNRLAGSPRRSWKSAQDFPTSSVFTSACCGSCSSPTSWPASR